MLLAATMVCLVAGVVAAYATLFLPAFSDPLEKYGGLLIVLGLLLLGAELRFREHTVASRDSLPAITSGQGE